MVDLSGLSVEELEDYEVLGLDTNGCLLQWDAAGDTCGTPSPYNSGETLEMFGEHNLTPVERIRCGFPVI